MADKRIAQRHQDHKEAGLKEDWKAPCSGTSNGGGPSLDWASIKSSLDNWC